MTYADDIRSIERAATRSAVAEDASEIAHLIRVSKRTAMPWLAKPHTLREDIEWVANVLIPHQRVDVVEADGALLAVIATTPGWVEQLYVAPSSQRFGVGSRLLATAIAEQESLRLWAFERNVRARQFYERHGFVAEAQTDGDNEECEPDILYVRLPGAATSSQAVMPRHEI